MRIERKHTVNMLACVSRVLHQLVCLPICVMASNPIKESADCSKPIIHATPSGQPVSLVNSVKTNSASVLGEVARTSAEVAIQAVTDQNTTNVSGQVSVARHLTLLTSSLIPPAEESIAEDVEADCEAGNR